MYRIMLASIYAHFFISIENVRLKVTKSNVISVDLVTFACLFKQKQTTGNSFAFSAIVLNVSIVSEERRYFHLS
jgi:hypothetical protein